MQLLNFGTCGPGDKAAIQINPEIAKLPKATLELSVRIGDELFTCHKGGQARLIESGRFMHRMDILGLSFVNAAGKVLEAESRLEIIAWPDSFTWLLEVKPSKAQQAAKLGISLDSIFGPQQNHSDAMTWPAGEVRQVVLQAFPKSSPAPALDVSITASVGQQPLKVSYEPTLQWHRIELLSQAEKDKGAEHLESSRIRLRNNSDSPQLVKLNFAKENHVPGITGLVAMFRDSEHYPTGIPLQLSKNWHVPPQNETCLYQGSWLHVLSMLTLPPHCDFELEFCLVQNFWGKLPLASHAQLCVIGCGLFQLWDQAAIGSWGESICYNPDRCAGRSVITDMRPLMVNSMNPQNGDPRWNWTSNVGGGDFLLYFDKNGQQQRMTEVRAHYFSQGPNLTDVCYTGLTADGAISSSVRVQTPRCQDLNRVYHHLRYEVLKPLEFSRLAFYQLGGDTYNDHIFKTLARGDQQGLSEEWAAKLGGKVYHRRGEAMSTEMPWFSMPWFSMHKEIGHPGQSGPWANRGLILRSWKARLGGRPAAAHFSSYGTSDYKIDSANIELSPPPELKSLLPGDFVEATLEVLVLPQFHKDYYGPDEKIKADLLANEDTWKPVFHQAALGAVKLTMTSGEQLGNYPLHIKAGAGDAIEFRSNGGITHTPLVISGLRTYRGYELQEKIGGEWRAIDQSVSGRDFWQTQYDLASDSYTLTFNIELGDERLFRLIKAASK